MKNQKGFTIIEMIMVIMVLGILLPIVILPFTQAGKGVTNSVDAARMAGVARYCMDSELANVQTAVGAWAGRALVGDYASTCTDPNNPTFTTAVTGWFYDATLTVRQNATAIDITNNTVKNKYLVITITTTAANGNTMTLQALRTRKG